MGWALLRSPSSRLPMSILVSRVPIGLLVSYVRQDSIWMRIIFVKDDNINANVRLNMMAGMLLEIYNLISI